MNLIRSFIPSFSPLQILTLNLEDAGIELYIKRDDLIHPGISGNKWRKLKYNLEKLFKESKSGIITFGGAFSNHLHAVAVAGREFGFETVGIVRGEKPGILSSTLTNCSELGMKLYFISRQSYKEKELAHEIRDILEQYPDFLLVPEGGENEEAKTGCAEILAELETPPDFICIACGTGTTLAGLLSIPYPETTFIGFPVLKGAERSISENIILSLHADMKEKWNLNSDYHFGGYAKTTPELLEFIVSFEKQTKVKLDQVYTGKMMFGLYDLISKGYFPGGSKIVAIHTGGLQGRLPLLDSMATV